MSDTSLPDGLMTLIKSAVRAQVAAMAVSGSTGPERVAHITGISRGHISRWCGDAHRDLPSLEIVFMLEHVSQKPIVSRALAQLSSHRLTPISDDDAPRECFVADLVEMTGTAARAAGELSSALTDGVVTPTEARLVLAKIAPHQDVITNITRKLSTVAND